MNHAYEAERRELEADLQRPPLRDPGLRPISAVLVERVDHETVHALQYAKTIRVSDVVAVHLETDPLSSLDLETTWEAAGLSGISLKILRGHGEPSGRLAGFVGGLPDDREVTVLLPVPHDVSAWERLSDSRAGAKLARALLPYNQVRVTLVRDHPDGVHPLTHDDTGMAVVRFAPRSTHSVVVLVDKLDRAVLRAVRYATALGATDVRAVHAAVDLTKASALAERWLELDLPIRLDILECWDRNVPRALEGEVLRLSVADTEVTVVMPRRDFATLGRRLLHDRTSRKIARALGRYPHVDVATVPYFMDGVRRPNILPS